MKLSISWIFDHIDAKWEKQDIKGLLEKFNVVSAEIEGFYEVEFNLDDYTLCKIEKFGEKVCEVSIPEWKLEIDLPSRDNSKSVILSNNANLFYMVKRSGKIINWATLKDFDQDKDGLIPALDVPEKDLYGGWKKSFETKDVILEIDNKSITHRPDMWGHRGFAREIAAMLNLDLLLADTFLAEKEVFTFDKLAKSTSSNLISIEIKDEEGCKRFAGISFDFIENRSSTPFIVSRLLKVGVRPINSIVDITNYLTLDWSQPVHAYDSALIDGKKIIVRKAKKNEKLILLDDRELELCDQDLVIADSKKPLCLAGVMGGKNSVITQKTKSIFFESANFDEATVRRTAFRYALRTESSARFEKTLDPNQNIDGILRFLKLLKDYEITFKCADEILSVGIPAEEKTLNITHSFLEKKSGLSLKDLDMVVPLEKLGFKVVKKLNESLGKEDREVVYSVTIPTFRGSKDVQIVEDILEEVIRFYGFERIPMDLPKLEKTPSDLVKPVFKLRKIKHFFANSAKMFEQQNYLFFDEQFLKSIDLKIQKIAAELINSVSQNYQRLINSLLPNLFKNIKDNYHVQDSLRFFEFNRVWEQGKKDEIVEKNSLAGIFFEKRKELDFYECKNHITTLFDILGFDMHLLEFEKIDNPHDSWIAAYQSAKIIFNEKQVGVLGKVDKAFLSKLDVLPESDAFFFELDGDLLINFENEVRKFKGMPKYQETSFDLSFLVPLKLRTIDIQNKLNSVDDLVVNTTLIDFFEKEEWTDKRSLTFRVLLNSSEKTLEGDQIETVRQKAIKVANKLGAELR